MKLSRALIAAAPIFIPLGLAHAQSPAIQQLQNMQQQQLQMPQPDLHPGTNAPELYQGENEDIGPQHILRLNSAAQAARRKYFEVSLDSQFFYSDNANFERHDQRVSSGVFVNTAQVAFAPDPYEVGPGKFAPGIGFSSQWYNYTADGMLANNLSFDAQTAFVNLRYLLGDWQFLAGANYTRLMTQGSYTETYNEWLPNLTVQRVIPITATTAFIVGDSVDYHFTQVPPLMATRQDINDHFDDSIFVTFNWQATSHLVFQPFYRFQYSAYKNNIIASGSRNDYLSAVGLTLLYNFNQYVSVRTFFSYTTKTSDDVNTPTYDELNGGIGATLDIRF